MINQQQGYVILNDALNNFKVELEAKSKHVEPEISKALLIKLFNLYSGSDFVWNNDNREVIFTILKYFLKDENFNQYGRVSNNADLKKGLLVFGPNGVGKSYLFNIIHKIGNHLKKYRIQQMMFSKISAKPFVNNYMKEIIRLESNFILENYYKGDLYIGDLGKENKAFGRIELMGDVIYERYRFINKHRTFITTNLPPSEINERYGDEIGDRLTQQFNIIKWQGKTFR